MTTKQYISWLKRHQPKEKALKHPYNELATGIANALRFSDDLEPDPRMVTPKDFIDFIL